MAQDKGQDNSSLIEALGEVVGSQIAKANAKKEPIAAVYTSGMRGDEKPPQLRNGDEGVKQAKEKGLGKGIDPKKAAAAQGRRKISFEAGPSKKELSKQLKALQDENAKLKEKNKKKITI
jgi:hypothetical protein